MAAGQDRILEVIGRIYDAALDPPVWQDVVREIAELQGCNKALMFTPMHKLSEGGFMFAHGVHAQTVQLRIENYAQHDIWTHVGLEKGMFREGNVVTDEDLVPLDLYLKSVLYRELGIRDDIVRLCTGIVFGPETPGVIPAALNLFRGLKDMPFGANERRAHSLLIPHVSRAMGVMCRLRDAEMRVTVSLAALDGLPSGVVLFGAKGDVVFANRASRGMFADEDGLRLRVGPNGSQRLATASDDAERRLQSELATCLDPRTLEVAHFSRAIRIERPSGRASYALQVSALPLVNEFGAGPEGARAIAFVTDPAEPVKLDEALLARLFGLTPAEFRLAERLCQGGSLVEVARALNLSENTVKSQLQSAFEKTRTSRQAELVKLLLSLGSTRVN